MVKIGPVVGEIFGGICQFLPIFYPVVAKIPQTPFLNSEVTELIFTITFLHDALVPLLMRAFMKQYSIPVRNT